MGALDDLIASKQGQQSFSALDGLIQKYSGSQEEPTGMSWGEAWESAKKVAPQNAFDTGVGLLKSLTPIPAFERFNRIMEDPIGESEATRKHYSDYFSEEGLKEKLATNPVGTAVEVGGMAALRPVRAAPKGPTPMPRGSVREGPELLKTGGERMKAAKLNPTKIEAGELEGPMKAFREKMAEDAIDLDPQFISPELMRRVGRLEGAYKPNPRNPEFGMTKVEPAAKPPVTLKELHGHSKGLNRFINTTGKTEGGINEQGYIAIELKKTVDEMIDLHPESNTFKIGRNESHRGKMAQSFDQIYKDASLTSQWRNGNEILALQNATAQFLKNKKNRYAFTPEIRSKMERFSRDKKGRLLSAFGSQTVSGSAAGRIVESAFGMPGLLWGPGMMARKARTGRLMDEWKRIGEEIRAGGPVGR
jgi:hypothetical protein